MLCLSVCCLYVCVCVCVTVCVSWCIWGQLTTVNNLGDCGRETPIDHLCLMDSPHFSSLITWKGEKRHREGRREMMRADPLCSWTATYSIKYTSTIRGCRHGSVWRSWPRKTLCGGRKLVNPLAVWHSLYCCPTVRRSFWGALGTGGTFSLIGELSPDWGVSMFFLCSHRFSYNKKKLILKNAERSLESCPIPSLTLTWTWSPGAVEERQSHCYWLPWRKDSEDGICWGFFLSSLSECKQDLQTKSAKCQIILPYGVNCLTVSRLKCTSSGSLPN